MVLPPDTSARSSSKQGIALIGSGAGSGSWDGPGYVASAQAALNDQDPAFWFNGHVSKQGLVPPRNGGVFAPTFQFLTDVSHANCLTALADADLTPGGNKIITTFGEPELPGSQNGITYTVADVVSAWGSLVNDSAWVGHPEVLFVSPYTALDGSATGSFFQQFLAGVAAAGYRMPDMLSTEKYGNYATTAAINVANIFTRFDNYHTAFPTYPIVGLGMSVLGPGSGPNPNPSVDYVCTVMQLLADGFESRSWVAFYTWFIAGPDTWLPFHAGQNMLLYFGATNPPQATPIGLFWKALCHRP